MHRTDHSRFRKAHDFVPDFSHAERRTRIVIGVTAVMMVVEIVVGLMSHSMALLADGWHMSTHVIAFLITAVAYYFARTQAGNARFSFGTGKIGVLGGFTSAVVLSIVAFLMAGVSACAGRRVYFGAGDYGTDRRKIFRMDLARSSRRNYRKRRGFFVGLHTFAGHQRHFARSHARLFRFTRSNSQSCGERRRFAGERSTRLAGRHRKICGDDFNCRARAEELRCLSSVAPRTRRTGPRHHRDATLPRRSSRACGNREPLGAC